MIKMTRTMNNMMLIGETEQTKTKTKIKKPFSLIPLQEGLRLVPLDIELTGVEMEEIELSNDKVFYTVKPTDVIINEYKKLLENPTPQEPQKETPKIQTP